MNIWRSIMNPVTLENISGDKRLDPLEIKPQDVDDIYYSRSTARDKMASFNIMLFHSYIKRKLLVETSTGMYEKCMLDFACGKAGDYSRWVDAKLKLLVGFDYSRDNIENPSDGAYSRILSNYERYEKSKYKNPPPPHTKYKYLFLGQIDCGERLDNAYVDNMNDIQDQRIAKFIWGMPSNVDKSSPLAMFKNIMAGNKFDIVSCQFALHYFFKSEQTLDNFLENVDNNLKDDGFFIGTCLDGFLVKKLLEKTILNGSELGKSTGDGRVLWNIKKLYSSSSLNNIGLGETIEVYMESIGKRIIEYLVDIKLLEKKLKQKKIYLVSQDTKDFRSYYDDYIAQKNATPLSDIEQRYSFANITFKFQKRLSQSPSDETTHLSPPPPPPPKVVKRVKKMPKEPAQEEQVKYKPIIKLKKSS